MNPWMGREEFQGKPVPGLNGISLTEPRHCGLPTFRSPDEILGFLAKEKNSFGAGKAFSK
jgi:hypothetical protein